MADALTRDGISGPVFAEMLGVADTADPGCAGSSTCGAVPMGEWRDLAACQDADPAVFYPVPVGAGYERWDDGRCDEALAVCARCPVAAECLDENLHEVEGVFGATTPRQRQTFRRQRGAARTGGAAANARYRRAS